MSWHILLLDTIRLFDCLCTYVITGIPPAAPAPEPLTHTGGRHVSTMAALEHANAIWSFRHFRPPLLLLNTKHDAGPPS